MQPAEISGGGAAVSGYEDSVITVRSLGKELKFTPDAARVTAARMIAMAERLKPCGHYAITESR